MINAAKILEIAFFDPKDKLGFFRFSPTIAPIGSEKYNGLMWIKGTLKTEQIIVVIQKL